MTEGLIPPLDAARTCSDPKCGRKIFWLEVSDPHDPDAPPKKICVDAVAACYQVVDHFDRRIIANRSRSSFVNHFVTCPGRDRFKRPANQPRKEKPNESDR
jgi:hypothetical protein